MRHSDIYQAQALCSTVTAASPQPAAGIRAQEVLRGERYCFPSLSDDADISMGRKTDVTRFRTTWCMCQKAIIQLSCHPAPPRMEAWGERDKSSRTASILRRPRANARGRVPKTRKVDSGVFGKKLRVQIWSGKTQVETREHQLSIFSNSSLTDHCTFEDPQHPTMKKRQSLTTKALTVLKARHLSLMN